MDRLISEQAVIKAVDKHTLDRSEIVLDEDITVILEEVPSVAIPNKTDLRQALYEIRETIDDWWDKRIITNHTVYKMLRKLVEEKMYRD